jgi:type III secretion protein R
MDFSTFSPALVLVTVIGLAMAPFVAVMVTAFTKIVVVLSLLRNALGLQQVPPNVVINGLAIVLSIYVMYPVILDTQAAITARMEGRLPLQAQPANSSPALKAAQTVVPAPAPQRSPLPSAVLGEDASASAATDGESYSATPLQPLTGRMDLKQLLALAEAGKEPLRAFLMKNSSDNERAFFLRTSQRLLTPERRNTVSANDFIVIVPAFTVSELTSAFKIGFLIFLPFLIIDLVISNILQSLGMMMLSPTTISLPFKLLLFVMIDGWAKLLHGLVLTYVT